MQVFPSDFGMERMAKERIEGPGFAGLWKKDKKGRSVGHGDDESGDSSDDDDESVDNSDSEESKNSEGSIKDGEEQQHSDEK